MKAVRLLSVNAAPPIEIRESLPFSRMLWMLSPGNVACSRSLRKRVHENPRFAINWLANVTSPGSLFKAASESSRPSPRACASTRWSCMRAAATASSRSAACPRIAAAYRRSPTMSPASRIERRTRPAREYPTVS